MTSKRRQLNMRLSPEAEALLDALVVKMHEELGISTSRPIVVQAALAELKKRYLPGWKYEPPAEPPPAKKRGRPKGSSS